MRLRLVFGGVTLSLDDDWRWHATLVDGGRFVWVGGRWDRRPRNVGKLTPRAALDAVAPDITAWNDVAGDSRLAIPAEFIARRGWVPGQHRSDNIVEPAARSASARRAAIAALSPQPVTYTALTGLPKTYRELPQVIARLTRRGARATERPARYGDLAQLHGASDVALGEVLGVDADTIAADRRRLRDQRRDQRSDETGPES